MQVSGLAKATMENLQALQDILIQYRRADEENRYGQNNPPIDASQAKDVHYSLLKHTNAFQRVADIVDGREDWSKLSPMPIPPLVPNRSPKPEPLLHLHSGEQSGLRVTVSPPRSPYQPFVEEFEGSSDEEVQADVESYHYVPGELRTLKTFDSMVVEPEQPEQPEHQHPATPPQLVLRTATDPDLMANMVDSPRQRNEKPLSPLHMSSSAEYDDGSEGSQSREVDRDAYTEHLHPSESSRPVTRLERHDKTVAELEEEMRKLQAEMEAMRVGRSDTRASDPRRKKSRRRHHHSVDLRHADDYPHKEEPLRRPRASTTLGAERPRSYYEGSSSESRRQTVTRSPRDAPLDQPMRRTPSGRIRLSPGHSPRNPPRSPRIIQSATDPEVDRYGRADPMDATQTYGVDPCTSLPTVIENRNTRPRRDTRTQRLSDDPEVFREFFHQGTSGGGDFELFGPPPNEPRRPRASSRTQSQSTSPGNQVPPSPRPQTIVEPPLQGTEPTTKHLPVTLEDLFHGTTKKVKIRRQRYNTTTGRFVEQERILDVPIYKGLKPGSKVKFQSEGDETVDGIKELHFVLQEKEHPSFTRKNYDLHMSIYVPLLEALCGFQRTITTICGKTVVVSNRAPTAHGWQQDFPGLGMCSHKNQNQRGDLIVGVSVRYPGSGPLSDRQKMLLREALSGR
ncbi:hypothetical protein EJ08DRAFT_649734 [Tothia fuscella]|uniref:Chaperone DnaJ C-terminal domain-containing protein n=1 Tax=Tothia fuscella TaxID=1048955 RepID=A0A9P4NS54_9PEZI|nr:hypothetical protein EJ08DRAFT_649734 [Tothia fuscella]